MKYLKKREKKYKVVIDANVIISAIFGGYPEKSVRIALDNECIAPKILQKELNKFLRILRKKNRKKFADTAVLFHYILSRIRSVVPENAVYISRDENDNQYISVAIQEKADFLVSGDNDILSVKETLKSRFKVMSPREFVEYFK